jgi:hypothetical protein
MTKEELTERFYQNHKEFIECINSFSDNDFIFSKNGKWTPGQQLDHVFLCLKPLEQVLSSKSFIEQKFGTITRPVLSYDEVIRDYKTALSKGGKAPERFVPETVDLNRKAALVNDTNDVLKTISRQLESYTETELDSLVLPHPLLNNLTIREMFYLIAYHATHHLNQTKQNLTNAEH